MEIPGTACLGIKDTVERRKVYVRDGCIFNDGSSVNDVFYTAIETLDLMDCRPKRLDIADIRLDV